MRNSRRPNLPISLKDWTGTEISRVYTDQWGTYNGLTYSTWEVNPPNPTGYAPTMMVTCMNDPGTGPTPDPLFNPEYSQFCYEIPFMPGQTQYMDTPVVPIVGVRRRGLQQPRLRLPRCHPGHQGGGRHQQCGHEPGRSVGSRRQRAGRIPDADQRRQRLHLAAERSASPAVGAAGLPRP